MDQYYSFLLGGLAIAIIVIITWLSSNLMRAERVIVEVDAKNQ
jgi:hypothetical protein